MANSKKIVQAAAGNVAGAGLNVEEIFITYLWKGNDATRTITNGIDLSNEGGMLWIKARTSGEVNWITDSERTLSEGLSSNDTSIYSGYTNRVTSYTSSGFTLGAQPEVNALNEDFVSWCFRKAEGFFDVVTWTGDGTSGREIAHNLGTTVGSIFVKKTNIAREWAVYHRGMGATHYGVLNNTDEFYDQVTLWNDTEPTSTHFTVGNNNSVNTNGDTYVAYLFAHNDGDGDFGPDGNADIIKCGSYTGNGSSTGPEINLGFEPQWLLIKNATESGSSSTNWIILDNMRGLTVNAGNDPFLRPNLSNAEASAFDCVDPSATGFKVVSTSAAFNTNGQTFIYIAIRRGPMAVPESATDVFNISTRLTGPPRAYSGFPVDAFMRRNDINLTGQPTMGARITASGNVTDDTAVEFSQGTDFYANSTGLWNATGTAENTDYFWMWRRANSYFDALTYSGNSTANRSVPHNLGVVPEMMWIKARNGARAWRVYHSAFTNGSLRLNSSAAKDTSTNYFGTPTADNIILGTDNDTNSSLYTYVAYLFATLDGVSKVGSFTSDGTDMTIDCGFSNGAKLVLLKRYNTSDDWFMWDSVRGITSGNDPRLKINTNQAQATGADNIAPDNSGFIIKNNILGGSGNDFIFYAVAI